MPPTRIFFLSILRSESQKVSVEVALVTPHLGHRLPGRRTPNRQSASHHHVDTTRGAALGRGESLGPPIWDGRTPLDRCIVPRQVRNDPLPCASFPGHRGGHRTNIFNLVHFSLCSILTRESRPLPTIAWSEWLRQERPAQVPRAPPRLPSRRPPPRRSKSLRTRRPTLALQGPLPPTATRASAGYPERVLGHAQELQEPERTRGGTRRPKEDCLRLGNRPAPLRTDLGVSKWRRGAGDRARGCIGAKTDRASSRR